MRTLNRWSLAYFWLALCSTGVYAQSSTNVPPPRLEKLEEGADPALTIRKNEPPPKPTEQREKGKNNREVRVQNGRSVYYARPNAQQPGNALPGDAQTDVVQPTRWRVFEFGPKTPQPEADNALPLQPAPPAGGKIVPEKK